MTLRTINEQELKDILDKHGKWLRNEEGGRWKLSRLLNGEYWVSNEGRIASLFHPCGSLRSVPKILKARKTKRGYFQIQFRKKNVLVHRIVADEFLAPVKNKIVHHKNADTTDNRSANLEVTTPSINNKFGHKTRSANKKIITEMIRYYRPGVKDGE